MERNDEKMREMLNDASLKALGHSVDSEAVWNKLSGEKSKGKSMKFKPWITHAAAVAAGILLAVLIGMNAFSPSKETLVSGVQVPLKEHSSVVHDTVFVAKQNESSWVSKDKKGKAAETIRNPETEKKQVPVASILPVNNVLHETAAVADTGQEVVVAKVIPAKSLPVMHLTDMDNENASQYYKSEQEKGYVLFNKITIPANTTDRSETISMLVVNQLSK